MSNKSKVILVHRRDEFRGAQSTVEKVNELAKGGKINLLTKYQLKDVKGSNNLESIEIMLDNKEVKMIAVEAAGKGLSSGEHAASLSGGKPGVLHGNKTYLLQNQDGQILDAHSISAGLDYPGIGPEHAWLHDNGRAEYVSITDEEALEAFQLCSNLEGILPALEPAHALAQVIKIAPKLPSSHIIVMNMCGRGDKDIYTVAEALGVSI